jgi:hypothetical protein
MEFHSDWQVKHEEKNRNNRIVVAHPSYPFDTDVSLTLAIHSKRDSALDDVVKFELEYERDLQAETDTILVSEPTEVSGHKGHKIMDNSRYETFGLWFYKLNPELFKKDMNEDIMEKAIIKTTAILESRMRLDL